MFSLVRRSRLRRLVEERDALRRQLRTDPLTGLANRAALDSHVASARGMVGCLLFDLDDFKPVNDTWGHRVGDQVLCAVAGRVAGTARPGEAAVRLHGDEFALWLGPVPTVADTTRRAAELAATLALPYVIDGRQLRVTASVGAAGCTAPVSTADLLAHADRQMYSAKRARRMSRRDVVALPVAAPAPTARAQRDGVA